MKKYLHLYWFCFSLFLYVGCSGDEEVKPTPKPEEKTLAEQVLEAEWDTTAVSDAIIWTYHHFDDLFSSRQSVTVFDIDLSKGTVTPDISYVTSGFIKTSEAAKNTRAKVAVNGSYFNTSTGGSTVFFRKDGTLINNTRSGFDAFRENAAFTIDAEGAVSIVGKPASGWSSLAMETVLAGGPLLISDGKPAHQENKAFNKDRHPRTAVGITDDNHLIAVVVDGRADEAQGMSIGEITAIMQIFGCVDAMNMDGGGSSTAYVINRGVVNYPCDNQKFDHEGERGVATVIVFGE